MTLAQVNTAIETILTGGQSVTIDGMTYTQANIGALTALREKMMAETGRATRPLFRGMNFSGMGYGSTSTDADSIVRTVGL